MESTETFHENNDMILNNVVLIKKLYKQKNTNFFGSLSSL